MMKQMTKKFISLVWLLVTRLGWLAVLEVGTRPTSDFQLPKAQRHELVCKNIVARADYHCSREIHQTSEDVCQIRHIALKCFRETNHSLLLLLSKQHQTT